MDRFRFRAWNKVRKKMITGLPYSSNGSDDFEQILKHPTIYTVMQCTGLKDKNGVLIFEGDIILASHYKWECKVVRECKVVWDEKCARFIGLTKDKDVEIVYVDMVDKNNVSAVEVIGNVHEEFRIDRRYEGWKVAGSLTLRMVKKTL